MTNVRNGLVEVRIALVAGLVGAPAGLVGAAVGQWLPERIALVLFAGPARVVGHPDDPAQPPLPG